jgi:hypothetical protein
MDALRLLDAIHGLGKPLVSAQDRKRASGLLGPWADLFAQARHVTDLALFVPSGPSAAADVARVLAGNQRDYEALDEGAVRAAQVAGSALCRQAEAFPCVVVPGVRTMALDVFRKLGQFAAAGGCLILVEPAPAAGRSPAETEAIAETWPGLLDAKQVARVASPEGCLGPLNRWLPPDLWLDEPCDDLVYCHREMDGRHLYLVANCGDAPLEREVSLRCQGRPELRDPATGSVRPAGARADGTRTSVRLCLEPAASALLAF